ncbi:MAG: hypothetical protein MJZ63_04735 [Muribaculaceae bacterium]|nr:hypothetical protein [Muribaculaceae bacterium]
MNERKNKIISAVITAIITLAVLLFMFYYVLPGVEVPPQEHPYVTMMEDPGGEMLAKLGDTPEPTESDSNDQNEPQTSENTETNDQPEGDELQNAGKVAPEPPKNITTDKPSPMKVKVKEEKKDEPKKQTGSSKPNPKPDAKAANQRSQGAASQESETDKRMKNAFGKGTGSGKTQGTPDGGSSTGDVEGHGTIGSGLVGYTGSYWGRPHSRYEGSVTVKVTVNPRGNVISAKAVSGTGEAWKHQEVRAYCERESLKSRFSVPTNRTTNGDGTITWRFK